jgi:hypothetical protein
MMPDGSWWRKLTWHLNARASQFPFHKSQSEPFCNKLLYEVIHDLPEACGKMEPSTNEMPVALVITSIFLGPNCQISWVIAGQIHSAGEAIKRLI